MIYLNHYPALAYQSLWIKASFSAAGATTVFCFLKPPSDIDLVIFK